MHGGGAPTFVVRRFREKPNAATAADYVNSGDYYWNSGIFVWKAKTILAALAERQPEMLAHLETIGAAWGTPQQEEVLHREFTAIKGISIDYAVMEHAKNVAVIEAPFDWDDLGSWQSLARLVGTDRFDNTIIGRHLGAQHPRHDRSHRRRAPGRHSGPEGHASWSTRPRRRWWPTSTTRKRSARSSSSSKPAAGIGAIISE